MRNAFAEVLTELAQEDQRIVLLYGDTGNRLFDAMKQHCPERTVNAGIAEANMNSVAAGLAKSGMRPITYAISPFCTSRSYEQIKVDIAYQNLPVVIVGTGSGLGYANLGPTHHSFEDIAIIRALPNMQLVHPADAVSLKALLPQIIESGKPTYFRIGKKREPIFYSDDAMNLEVGKIQRLRQGSGLALISTGPMLPIVAEVADRLEAQGVSVELADCHTVKPLDKAYLFDCAARVNRIVTIEEHSLAGGFGSAVLETLSDHGYSVPVTRLGIPDVFLDKMAGQREARSRICLDADGIMKRLEAVL